MPQLMPLFWCFSIFLVFMLYMVVFNLYFIKKNNISKVVFLQEVNKNWMW